ncbi:MAG: STAS domain-containing protein [Deferribacteres bacterium]|nr:STAS domain-containing protein [candidate division KSB1 bacterium]MCB9508847.1 STAS domain-containing protein [Deferribacteres bacterium]
MLEIVQSQQNDIAILSLQGRLDTNTSSSLETTLVDLVEKSQKKLLLDLSALEFISSSGLRVLLMIAKRVKGMDGKMVLTSLKSNVQNVFEMAGFTMLFTILPSNEKAIEALQ